jgi:hypothetical protein
MPTATYTALATVTLASTASSVTFSSIPATYRDFVVVFNWGSDGDSNSHMRLNGDSGSNYSTVSMAGESDNSTNSTSGTSQVRIFIGFQNSTTRLSGMAQIMDYSATDKHKTILSRFDTANRETQATASRWASTSAITSIRFFDILGQTFQTGATFSLYGVA